ncbi:MAG TPA: chromosome segregation protein SMC [Opitutaceae bacterium]|nr:chromosome segregation protein SMC [Opitutaceae bacterium]
MYLKALKLHGFKSFADSTCLRFEPGVTSIVGPNGCGKSNIADAIRWVLGEQSAKALRGGKMQDVIFEGADTRKPAQLCEVSLLLTDCEKQLGSEFHEIEVMRRTSRDGQGEYFFNGQPCRLKDIHKLFMDTGIGRTSYSIMAQGQIDQILSSKPEERRAVFEEAAGITKYKSQRREAMNKLALTEQNLARVADVVGEVSRQIGSLKRQAAKALRYKKLNFRLGHLSLAFSGWQFGQLRAVLGELETKAAALRTEADGRRAALAGRQGELDEKKSNRSRLNQRVQDAQQAVFDLRSQKEQAENQANVASIKRTGLQERLESSRNNLGETEMQVRELAVQVDTGAQDKQMQLGLLGSSDAAFQTRNRELALSDGELSKIEQELQQAKFHLLQLESTVARLRTECSGYEVDQKTSALRHDGLAQELEQVRTQQAAAAHAAGEFNTHVEEAQVAKSRAHNEAQAAQQSLSDLTREFRDAQRKLQDTDRQLAQRTARLKLLQQLQEKFEGFGEGSKALLSGRFAAALGDVKATPVTQGFEVKPEFGPALEALLGAAVEAIHVADLGTAKKILAQLEGEQLGSVCLQISDLKSQISNQEGLPPFLIPVTSTLNDIDPAHPALSLLTACYIADDLGAFLDFWKSNPGFSFLAVATRKGELVDRRGLVFGGYGKKSVNGILQRDIDLRETKRELAKDQKAHDEQRAHIDLLNGRIAVAEQTIEQKRADVLAVTQAMAAAQTEQRNAQRSLDEVVTRLRRMEGELTSLAHARDETQQRFAKAQAGLTEADVAATQQREKISQLEARIVEVRAERDQKKESLAQARLELAERRQKVEVLDRGLGEMERRRLQLQELLAQRQQEIEVWTEQITELELEAAAQRARGEELAKTLVVTQESVEKIRIELVEVEREISASEAAQASVRAEAELAQGELGRCEVKLAENRSRAEFITEEARREFQAELATVDWKHQLWHADDEPEGLKPLDLEEDEPEAGGQKPEAGGRMSSSFAKASDSAKATTDKTEDREVRDQQTEPGGEAKPKGRKPKPKQKGEPTEADLAALDATNWDELRAEVEALRQRLRGMGEVNLVAIEEYAELKQRHDFLKGQTDDLTNARVELLKAIDEINQTSQNQFTVTFEQVKKNFAYTFQTLFGGGRAELEIIESGDILESGIEIVAQPPGTKLKGITLLSGGQKTLTAVALLFALYMVKPSPFCLLDELDAPLDESNIGRFTDLLKKFVGNSQFIIITHNKRTIAAADAIYGVTMEERGVSKTVSMRFNHEHGEAEVQSVATVADAVRGAQPPVHVEATVGA